MILKQPIITVIIITIEKIIYSKDFFYFWKALIGIFRLFDFALKEVRMVSSFAGVKAEVPLTGFCGLSRPKKLVA